MRVLAVGAHPDDVELGCFATLLEWKRLGHDVIAVALASGPYGEHAWSEIESAWKTARSILVQDAKGTSDYVLGDFPMGKLKHEWTTVGFVDDLIQKYDIDTVLAHHYGEAHQDHTAAQKIAVSAARRHVRSLYLWESVIYTHRNVFPFRPQTYVAVQKEAFEGKIKALEAYRNAGLIEQEELDAHRHLARYRGIEMGREFAEAFEVIWQVL